jgi:polar amino acid transport system substrate-binding protein
MLISRRGVSAGLAALGLARPGFAAVADGALDRVQRTKVMRVGVVNNQPPYSYQDLATRAWAGFMVDIAKDLASTQGAVIEPVESTWGNAALDIEAGKVDIFFCLAPTPQRALVVDFTRPLFENAFALIARNGFESKTWHDLDTPETRVALEMGTVYDQNVAHLSPRASLIRTRNASDATLQVQTGRADCQMMVVILALTALARNPGLGHLVVPSPVFGSPTAAIVAKEADQRWLRVVDDWVGRRRGEGWLRGMLVANLEKVGVRGADVPPELLF